MIKAFICASVLMTHSAQGQAIRMPVTTHYTRLETYSLHQQDAFSFTANPAALPQVHAVSIGVYGEKRFLVKELNLCQFAVVVPTSSGHFGVQTTYFGTAEYHEMATEIAYGRTLSDKISIGGGFNYYNVGISGYGSASAVTVEGGLFFKIREGLQAGVHLYNPSRSKIGRRGEERLPFIYTAGVGYDASEKLFISAAVQKAEGRPVAVQAGLHYQLDEKLLARGGFDSGSSVYYFGCGVLVRRLRVEATASVHPYLGLTPALLLLYTGSDATK